MRKPILIVTVLMAALLTAPANTQDKANPPRKERLEASAKKIKELQKERIDTLVEIEYILPKGIEIGARASIQEFLETNAVIEAKMLLLKARLEYAEKESDRLKLYQHAIDVLKKMETFNNEKERFGRGTHLLALKYKATRLEVEIDLERAKAKEAK